MSTKLYVGSLPYSVNDDSLREIFSKIGAVESAKVIADFHSGRSKGFGFVEMANAEDAQKAIQDLHGSQCEGRTLIVSEARPQTRREGGGAGGAGGGRGGRSGGGRGGFGGGGSRGGFGGGRRDRDEGGESY